MLMSIPPFTSFTKPVSIGAFPHMGAPSASPFIASYSSLVSAPPYTILLDMALLATCPTDRCFLLVWRGFALAFVRVILGVG